MSTLHILLYKRFHRDYYGHTSGNPSTLQVVSCDRFPSLARGMHMRMTSKICIAPKQKDNFQEDHCTLGVLFFRVALMVIIFLCHAVFCGRFLGVKLEVRCIPCKKVVNDCHISTGFRPSENPGKLGGKTTSVGSNAGKLFFGFKNNHQVNTFTADVWRCLFRMSIIFDDEIMQFVFLR